MTTQLIEAARQALEALEYASTGNRRPEIIEPAITAIRAALEQPAQEPVAIKWTLDGDKTCGYNNWLGKTPFGRILITWKGWKKYHDACVDEFPGDFHAYGLPDEVKELCEAEFAKRIGYTTSPQRKPLTDEQMKNIWYETQSIMGWYSFQEIARAIEQAHGIGEKNLDVPKN